MGNRFGTAIALSEPGIDLVLEVIDNAGSAMMMGWTFAPHPPFGERRATDTDIFGGFYGPEPFACIGGHCHSSWQL